MRLTTHTTRQYTDALHALLPLGAAWEWQPGGFGDGVLTATALELTRLEPGIQSVIDEALELHRPSSISYTLPHYQQVADANTRIIPRKYLSPGCRVGYRCWSSNAPSFIRWSLLSRLSHLIQPLAVGAHVGDLAWSHTSRYYLMVELDRSLIDTPYLIAALTEFKQAHVYLYIHDVPDLSFPGFYYWDTPSWTWDDPVMRWY
jgi:hypothetical protein